MPASQYNQPESRRIILCADIGSSSLKAAFIDTGGGQWAFARESYARTGTDGDAASLPAGVDASDWEKALARALGCLFSQAPKCRPAAVCISGNGPTLVPVDREGVTLAPLHWYQGPLGNTGPQKADTPAVRSFFLPHVLRFIREHPGEYAKTQYFFSTQEWLSWRLGAEPVTVLPEAYGPYYWDDDQCRMLGLDRGKFPPFTGLGSVIGRLAPAAIRRMEELSGGLPEGGLAAGIPLIGGGSDFIMALIGTGTLEPGMVCDRAGSSEGINLCSADPAVTGELRVLPHIAPNLWNISAILPASGRIFEWYRTLTGQGGRPYADTLADLIPQQGLLPESVTGGALFFPAGGTAEQAAALIGRQGLFSPLELGQAVLEAMGFMVKAGLDTLGRHGFPIKEMRLSGGQGKNRQWNQLKADMTGVILLDMEQRDAELGGDAVLGALALGEAADLAQGVARIVHIRERFYPDPAAAAVYGERFQHHRELRDKIGGIFHEML
jgi:xylulokinase